MQFDAGTWWLISILLTALITIIGALVGRTVFGKLDENSKDIKQVRESYVPRDDHTRDIKEVRDELRGENQKLSDDIKDIKENCARKDDFVRGMTSLERKIDVLTQRIIDGGTRNG